MQLVIRANYKTAEELDQKKHGLIKACLNGYGIMKMSLESFLSNDDTVTGYHINKWQDSSDNNLSNLCNVL